LEYSINEINTKLLSKITWLDSIYGISERRQDTNENNIIYPAIYIGNNEYQSLIPNTDLGNFSFFHLYDPQRITDVNCKANISVDFSLIIWYDLSKIFTDIDTLHIDELESDILTVLLTKGLLKFTTIKILNIYMDFKNVYKDYNFDMGNIANKQYFTHPYYAIRIYGTIKTNNIC